MIGVVRISIDIFASVLSMLIFARVIVSWLPPNIRQSPLIQLLYLLTEPILAPIRKLLSNSPLGGPGMMLDFSPIIAFMLIEVAKGIILRII